MPRTPQPTSTAPVAAGTDPKRRVMDALRRVVRGLRASAHGPASDSPVTGAQLFLLRQIAAAPGLGLGELAARSLAGQSTVSEVVARLVERRLVARGSHPADARQATLTLTRAGQRIATRNAPTVQERLAEALATLPAAQRQALATGLEAWLAAADLTGEPASMFFEDRTPVRPRSDRRG